MKRASPVARVRRPQPDANGADISRWITSHGFVLNLNPELSYFQYIVPCGLSRPVTSMAAFGSHAPRAEVVAALARHFAGNFQLEIVEPVAPIKEAVWSMS